jgi:hypothetical protein
MNSTDQWPGLADLHMHTTDSDGFSPVDAVLNHIADHTHLNVIAITDHDAIDASLWAYTHRDQYPFDIVPGVEVSSRDGHVLALWVTHLIPRDMSLADTAAAIHDQGGIAILAHPFEVFVHGLATWRYLTHPEVLLEANIDAVEVHNSGALTPFAGQLARRMARQLQLPVVGNSDAHSLKGIARGITHFKGKSALDLRHALVNHETVAEGTAWPIIDYLKLLPGTTRRKLSGSLEMSTR